MPIVVNTNISSINAQRNLSLINRSYDKSLERLASGLRINKAGDDAAGLAIADGLNSQVRGLTQAVRNANDGLSVVGVAEGTLTTQVTILQRIRELSIQAANDINSSDNRGAIQQEISTQIDELTRLGNTTEFNGQMLLNGLFQSKKIQVGAFAGQTIDISIGDFRATGMGQIATQTGSAVDTNAIAGGGDLTINTVSVDASTDDGVSTYMSSASALAKANAINSVSSQTGVTATAQDATATFNLQTGGGNIATTTNLVINGVTIFNNEAFAVQSNDADGTIRNKINAKSAQTGVVASLTGTGAGTRIQLTAADGRNVEATTTAAGAQGTALGINTTRYGYGTVTLTSYDDFNIGGTGNPTNLIGIASGTYSVDPSKVVSAIDVTTQTGANTAIQIVDSALNKVASAQADLGALTNRLENTISNLEISIENLSAAESRIRDADFAQETANLTRAQIIQQSAIAVLTQANVKPQAALTLIGA